MSEEAAAAADAPKDAEPAAPSATPERMEERRQAARLMTYRLVPLWMFLFVFGVTLAWEAGVRGNPITSERFQAAALISLFIALFVGAPIGIRFFNPLPPKK